MTESMQLELLEIIMILLGICGALCIVIIVQTVARLKQSYKISYYETKLKNRDVDISHIENISIMEILLTK